MEYFKVLLFPFNLIDLNLNQQILFFSFLSLFLYLLLFPFQYEDSSIFRVFLRYINHLQEVHDDLDKQIKEEYIRYGNDALVQTLKKKKLALKDEIENFRKQVHENL